MFICTCSWTSSCKKSFNPYLWSDHLSCVKEPFHKQPAPVTDTFFMSWGCLLTSLGLLPDYCIKINIISFCPNNIIFFLVCFQLHSVLILWLAAQLTALVTRLFPGTVSVIYYLMLNFSIVTRVKFLSHSPCFLHSTCSNVSLVLLMASNIACVASVSSRSSLESWDKSKKNMNDGGGEGERRNRLPANPTILKNCVRPRTQPLIGAVRVVLIT